MPKKSDPSKKRTFRNGNAQDFEGSRADENSLRPESAERSRNARDEAEALNENTIRARRARSQSHAQANERSTAPSEQPTTNLESSAVPDHINARYIKVGNKYHFPNGDLAFKDRGRGLSTGLENTEVIRDLVAIAKERGWNEIVLGGTERFRKEAWQQANLAGLSVRGYRATELERAQLVRRMGREREGWEAPSTDYVPPSDRSGASPTAAEQAVRAEIQGRPQAPDRVHAGRLLGHGAANYKHDQHAEMSYFVRIETADGERTLWGKDLERAVQQSLSRAGPGDAVVVRQLGAKPVTVIRPVRDEEDRIVDRTQVQTHLNRWSVERADFLKERAQVAEIVRDPSIDAKTGAAKRPELAGTYTELHAAKLIAQELFVHPADRARFITRVREAIADEIERGEPLSAPRVRTRTRDEAYRHRSSERAQERVLS